VVPLVRGEAVGAAEVARVFDEHAAYVGRTLRCLGISERELPDAIQEVFLVVHRRLGEFAGRASLRTWLYAIALRVTQEHRRRGARRREDVVARPPEPEVAPDASPERLLEQRRALATALEILEGIAEEKRTVFVLYEVEQLSMTEVADLVGCPLQTAYSRLHSARTEIARALKRRQAQRRLP
jgi:RNA polymerase sigma-70 factor (ECF subfamily)